MLFRSQRIRPVSESRDIEDKEPDEVVVGASDGDSEQAPEQDSEAVDSGAAQAAEERDQDQSNDRVMQVMLLPTKSDADQPQVEWSDWEGVAQITTDSEQIGRAHV